MPGSPKQLAQILEAFNRKERNLLVRDILGHAETKLRLSDDFRQRIDEAAGVTLSPEAWWATDYHFDWLFAALTVLYGNTEPGVAHKDQTPKLIVANQEDVDLVIADGQNLILIEAKAHEAWSNEQAASKRQRFESLLGHNEALRPSGSEGRINLHFLLMSRTIPKSLRTETGLEPLRWLPFKIDASLRSYRVKRCEANGTINERGGHWLVVEKPAAAAPERNGV